RGVCVKPCEFSEPARPDCPGEDHCYSEPVSEYVYTLVPAASIQSLPIANRQIGDYWQVGSQEPQNQFSCLAFAFHPGARAFVPLSLRNEHWHPSWCIG